MRLFNLVDMGTGLRPGIGADEIKVELGDSCAAVHGGCRFDDRIPFKTPQSGTTRRAEC